MSQIPAFSPSASSGIDSSAVSLAAEIVGRTVGGAGATFTLGTAGRTAGAGAGAALAFDTGGRTVGVGAGVGGGATTAGGSAFVFLGAAGAGANIEVNAAKGLGEGAGVGVGFFSDATGGLSDLSSLPCVALASASILRKFSYRQETTMTGSGK